METLTIYSHRKVAQANLSFIMEQILAVMKEDTKNCKVVYLSRLICRARVLMCPHTKDRSFCPEWDRLLAYGLLHCVSRCILPQAWERQIKEIINHDLKYSDPYDGSVGHVVHLSQVMKNILDAVVCNDKKAMMLILQRSKLRLPVLNISDEFGWNLLHHAAFHSATDVMKALVFEGISPLEVCRQGQTPIHVAAAALRYGALTTFSSLGTLASPTALTLMDTHGRTPLYCLLHALAVGPWHRKLSSSQLLDFIKLLLVQQGDIWDFKGEEDTAAIRQQEMTAFTLILLHSDAFVAEGIIKCAYNSLFARQEGENNGYTLLETSKLKVVFELKRAILLIIRRKKSRVLACLLTTFGELLFDEQSITNEMTGEMRSNSSTSGLLSPLLPQQNIICFLHQCLFAASACCSLRIMSMLLKFGALICPSGQDDSGGIIFQKTTKELYFKIISVFLLGRSDDATSPVENNTSLQLSVTSFESFLVTSAFLLVPVLRADSSMLRLIIDHMEADPVTLLWLSAPCVTTTTASSSGSLSPVDSPDMVSSPILCRSTALFHAWCRRGRLRQSEQLLDIAHGILSPLATACLRDEPYLLKLMLNKHWCNRNTSVAYTQDACSSTCPPRQPKCYLYTGLNPLICCLLSGSVECMTLLQEHFGETHFANMCNCKDDLNLLPLFSLMLLLRVKLKKRVFVSSKSLSVHSQSETFVRSVMRYYSLFSPSHTSTVKMLRLMLPHIQFQDVQAWQDLENILDNETQLKLKIEKFQELKDNLQSHVVSGHDIQLDTDAAVLTTHDIEQDVMFSRAAIHQHIATSRQQWEYMQWSMGTVAFGSSLRTLGTVICKKPEKNSFMQTGAGIDEIRMNRQFLNITRCVVLLLRSQDVQVLSSLQTDWWNELDLLINNDFSKNCKLARLMLAMRGEKITNEVLLKVQEYVNQTDKWLKQGNALLPPRKSNCNFVHNCFIVLDIMHKWSSLVVNENIRFRLEKSEKQAEKEQILLQEDILALECVVETLQSYSQTSASSPFMALLGEECTPLGLDIAICAAGALVYDNPNVLQRQDFSSAQTLSLTKIEIPESSQQQQHATTANVIDNNVTRTTKSTQKVKEEKKNEEENDDGYAFIPVSKQPIVRNLDNIINLCNDVLSLLLDDSRILQLYSKAPSREHGQWQPFFTLPDLCGLTPLLGMCSNDLWLSAEKAIASVNGKTYLDNNFPNTDTYVDSCGNGRAMDCIITTIAPLVFFPGGLKDYTTITDPRLSLRLGGEIRSLLTTWGVGDIPLESECGNRHKSIMVANSSYVEGSGGLPVQVVDIVDLAVLKQNSRFVLFLLAQPMFVSRSTRELMILSYVTNNVQLCLDIALEGDCNNNNNTNPISFLKLPSYFPITSSNDGLNNADNNTRSNYEMNPFPNFSTSMRRFCNNIYAFTVGYNVKHNKCEVEDFFIRTFTGHASVDHAAPILPIAQCAARFLIDMSQQTRAESLSLHVECNSQVQSLAHRSTSILQAHQQKAVRQYGFRPVYKGPFAGLCFSNDGRIWVMDGSLMEKADFFSNVANLTKALPVPQTTQKNLSSAIAVHSGYTIVHAIVNRVEEMSEQILEFIFLRLSCIAKKGSSTTKSNVSTKQIFLSTDIKKRSPVFLAITRGNIELAQKMLLSSSTCTISSESMDKEDISISKDGLCYHFLKTSANMVTSLELELADRLQGSYRENNVSGALMHLLMVHLDRVDMLWEYLQHKCEIGTLSRLIYDPSGQVIDCFQRAKSILLLLNIPFSQLHNKLVERKSSLSEATESGPEKEETPLKSRYKNLSPETIKKLVPWKTAMALQKIVKGWVQLRAQRNAHEESAATVFNTTAPRPVSLQSIYASKMKQVIHKHPNYYPSKSKEHFIEHPFQHALASIESSVLLYHSVDLSLVTYGFASVHSGSISDSSDKHHCDENTQESRHLLVRDSLWNSPFPPLLLAETRHLREKESQSHNGVHHMAQLLTMYKKNSTAIQRAMQCAYTILEFARTLSTTRILVTLTQEVPSHDHPSSIRPTLVCNKNKCKSMSQIDPSAPSASVPCLRKQHSTAGTPLKKKDAVLPDEEGCVIDEAVVRHPVDEIRHAIICARANFNSTKSFISELGASSAHSTIANDDIQANSNETCADIDEEKLIQRANRVIENEYLSHGAGSRLRLTDALKDLDMQKFLTLKSEISPMFTNLRHILIESLLILMKVEVDPSTPASEEGKNQMIAQLNHYLSHNCAYDERVLLEGDESEAFPLSPKECALLSNQMLTFIKNISIKSITGVKLDLTSTSKINKNKNTPDAAASNDSIPKIPTFTPQLSSDVIEKLFQHVLAHPTIYCHNASVPTMGRLRGYGRDFTLTSTDAPTYVPLAQCPSVFEQNDLLNLVGYSSGNRFGKKYRKDTENNINASNTAEDEDDGAERDISNRTGAALKQYLSALNSSYRLSESIIELILTIIGLHSMGDVYLLDFHNSSGGLKCSPYISLCYTPTPRSSSSITKPDKRQNDIVECFLLLQKCDIALCSTTDSSASYFNGTSDHPAAHIFSEFSELQYMIFCAALFGKALLLQRLLDAENQHSCPVVKMRQNSCLLWYVLLICPPPSNNYADYDINGSYQRYSRIALLLLRNGYGTCGPVGSQLSVLDLASLKQLPEVFNCLLQVFQDANTRPDCVLNTLGAFQFIALSKKFGASTLQFFLSMHDFNFEQVATTTVALDHFVPACINDSEIFVNMFGFVSTHIDTYRKCTNINIDSSVPVSLQQQQSYSLEDVLEHSVQWSVDMTVHLLSNALLGIFYSFNDCSENTLLKSSSFSNRTKHCPLFDIVCALTNEIRSINEFTSDMELNTVVKALNWSNLHFLLCGKMESKFQAFFTHFCATNMTNTDESRGKMSSVALSRLLPLLGLADMRCGQLPCDLLHFVCFYSMGEPLKMLLEFISGHNKEFDLSLNLFFAPLNSSMTPLDVALTTGSSACVSTLLAHAKEHLSFHEVNSISWKMLYASLGKGLGGETMATMLLRFITSVYKKHSKISELIQAINLPIVNNMPRSGVVSQETLLHLASRRGFERLCLLLLEEGAEASKICPHSGLSVIKTSIASGHTKVTRALASYCTVENKAALKITWMFRLRVLTRHRTKKSTFLMIR